MGGFSFDPSQWGNDINQLGNTVGSWFNTSQQGAANVPQIPGVPANSAGGVSGADAAGQNATNSMLTGMANGTGPNAGNAIEQQGVKQGQALAQAQAGSARGSMGLANAQHQAMATGAENTQAGAAQGAVIGAQSQQNAIQNLASNQQAQRAQDLQAQGMGLQQATSQAQLEANTQQANQQAQGNMWNTITSWL